MLDNVKGLAEVNINHHGRTVILYIVCPVIKCNAIIRSITKRPAFLPAQHRPQLRVKTSTAEQDRSEWRKLVQNGYILPKMRQSMIVMIIAK